MAHRKGLQTGMAARRDAALIGAVSAATAVICVKLDLSEALLGWTKLHERLQLDELPAVLLVIATSLIWFSARRYLEARGQLQLRRDTEQRLAAALAENQRLAQQYLDVQERERKALARDLHDELGQYLNVMKLDAVSIRDAGPSVVPLVDGAARSIIDNVDRVYATVSNLIRQLRPAGFDELGLAAALEYCVNDWRARLPEAEIGFRMEEGFRELDEPRALATFRLVQEALTNVARHSHASCVQVGIARRRRELHDCIEVSIADNGNGADLGAPRAGLGLIGMRERVAAFGGSLALSSRRGEGFRVLASFPTVPAVGGRAA